MNILRILTVIEVVIRLIERLTKTVPAIKEIIERAENGETITDAELDAGIAKVKQAADGWDASVAASAKNSIATPGATTPSG